MKRNHTSQQPTVFRMGNFRKKEFVRKIYVKKICDSSFFPLNILENNSTCKNYLKIFSKLFDFTSTESITLVCPTVTTAN